MKIAHLLQLIYRNMDNSGSVIICGENLYLSRASSIQQRAVILHPHRLLLTDLFGCFISVQIIKWSQKLSVMENGKYLAQQWQVRCRGFSSLRRCTSFTVLDSCPVGQMISVSSQAGKWKLRAGDLPKWPRRVAGIHPLLIIPSSTEQRN